MNTTEYYDTELYYAVYIFFTQTPRASSMSRGTGLRGPKPQRYCMTMISLKQ